MPLPAGARLAAAGRRDEAGKIIQELAGRATREYADPGVVALIYAEIGRKDQAFAWLERAYDDRSQWMTWMKVEPEFDPLRRDPRFQDLLRRVGPPQ